MSAFHEPDQARAARIGITEAVYAQGKSVAQLDAILRHAMAGGDRLLVTRLDPDKYRHLAPDCRAELDYVEAAAVAVLGGRTPAAMPARVVILTGGTSDAAIAMEAALTLEFHGVAADLVGDIGVAGLHRLLARIEAIASYPVIIAVAGMEGALFSVLGGLVGSLIIAVPTSQGYGVTAGGRVALDSALGSCAPGLLVTNIDNGYGAACAALRCLRQMERAAASAG